MGAAGIHGSLILNVSLKAKHSGWCFEAAGHWGHLLSQGRQTHFHRGPLQPHGFLQRAEIILGLCKCNYSLTVKELKLHSALWRHPRGWCGPWWTWVYMDVLYVDVHMLQMHLCVECQQVAARGRLWHRSDLCRIMPALRALSLHGLGWPVYPMHPNLGFPASALLMFVAGWLFAVGAVLCFVGIRSVSGLY